MLLGRFLELLRILKKSDWDVSTIRYVIFSVSTLGIWNLSKSKMSNQMSAAPQTNQSEKNSFSFIWNQTYVGL